MQRQNRRALLDADVAVPVVREFTAHEGTWRLVEVSGGAEPLLSKSSRS